jgi:hypothetical protein
VPQLPDYHLAFEHEQLKDIEVTMGRLSIDELFDFNEVLALPASTPQETKAYCAELAAFIGKHTVAWNLEDREGAPVPVGHVTDQMLLFAIRNGWLEGINGGATPPLDRRPDIEADLADLADIPDEPPPGPNGSENAPAS